MAEFLLQFGQVLPDKPRIARTPRESPAFRPDWRILLFQQLAVEIAQAKDESLALARVVAGERDPFVRQILLWQFGRRSVIPGALVYAWQCQQCESENWIGAMIAGMVVAGRTSVQIAREIGTDPLHVRAFEKLCFDVRPYLQSRSWLKQMCYSLPRPNEPAYRHAKRRYLVTAYERGWAGLAPILLRPSHVQPRTGRQELNRFWQTLLARAADFVNELEVNGTPLAERDVILLRLALHEAKGLGLPATASADLDYAKPGEPDEEQSRQEAQALVRKLTLEQRKRVGTLLQTILHRVKVAPDTLPPVNS
jgi:hypothetical protein